MSQHFLQLALVAFMATACFAAEDKMEWNYVVGDHAKGPDSWAKNFAECAGTKNSPINLFTNKCALEGQEAASWDLTNWDVESDWTVLDNGYTVKFSLEDGQTMTTEGGDLGSKFEVVQFHFHWGSNDHRGSEHLVDGRSFPMEVHFVHKNSRYATMNDAVASGESDAFAAVGFFFEIQDEDNADLDDLIAGVTAVRSHNESRVRGIKAKMTDFASSALQSSYYRYFGGLTTPGCQEIVLWTVFTEPIGISSAQMEIFRNQTDHSRGVDFYRVVQPLGSRTLTLYDTEYSADDYVNSADSFHAFNLLTFVSLFIAKFF